jgi:ribose 1,5-bisphosphate isomerase
MKKTDKIFKDIKNIKIQGATNIAKAAFLAYSLSPTKKTKEKLLSLRPTEPMLMHTLAFMDKFPKEKVLSHFSDSQYKINKLVFKIIPKDAAIYTHCHSTNVVKALIYAKEHGKSIHVYNTETRPLFQGRITAKELANANIPVTHFVDSAFNLAIAKSDILLLGADAILKDKVINKIGSDAIAELAYLHKKPLYIVADSWKYASKNVPIEERDFKEVWAKAPKHIKVKDPAFSSIDKKYVKKIISELGILSYSEFIKKAKKQFN